MNLLKLPYIIFLDNIPQVRAYEVSFDKTNLVCSKIKKEDMTQELCEYFRLMYEYYCAYSYDFMSKGTPNERLKFKACDPAGSVFEELETINLRFNCPRGKTHDIGDFITTIKFVADDIVLKQY